MQKNMRREKTTCKAGNGFLLILMAICLLLPVPSSAEKSVPLDKELFLVKNLPGVQTEPNFKQYAGYLSVNRKQQDKLFFWMFESQSSPQNDPLIIWLSGGPGCSSIAAMFEENGAFQLGRDRSGDIKLTNNPHSWNERATVLYLDQPVGTGMSYSGTNTFSKNQHEVNKDFYEFLKQLYAVFPEYEKKPLFIVGESYAGHMIPGITDYILDQGGKPGSINVNLQGLAIGNGWVDPLKQRQVLPDVFYAAGMIDKAKRDEAKKLFDMAVAEGGVPPVDDNDFGPGSGEEGYVFPAIAPQTPYSGLTLPSALQNDPSALVLQELLDKYKGKYINASLSLKDFIAVIDIVGQASEEVRKLLPMEIEVVFLDHSYPHLVFQFFLERLVSYTEHDGNYVNLMDVTNYGPTIFVGLPSKWPADDAIFTEYMDKPEVRQALHIQSYPHAQSQPCNPMVSYVFNYLNKEFQKSFLFLYPRLLNAMPVLFYNGQHDLICSPMGTQEFLLQIASDPLSYHFPGKKEYAKAPYLPWVVAEQQSDGLTHGGLFENRYGYYKHSGNLHFLNVLDASHMVPLSRPEVSLILINNFIHEGKVALP